MFDFLFYSVSIKVISALFKELLTLFIYLFIYLSIYLFIYTLFTKVDNHHLKNIVLNIGQLFYIAM